MKEYQLSVIIPVHNTDLKLFSNCIDSLNNQEIGFENIEVIVVLHNCNKETVDGAKHLLTPFENVIIAELNNDSHSPSSPRNYGIEKATGDYITFLDSDDMLTPECLRLAYKYVTESESDICHFRKKIQLEQEGAITFNELVLWDNTKEKIIVDKQDLDPKKIYVGAWGMSTARLYKRQLIENNNLRFDETIKFAEDYHFVIGAYSQAERICLAPQLIGYIYYVNGGSLVQSTKISEELLLQYVSGFKKVFDKGIENGIWMNDTMGSLMLIILNWMKDCTDLSNEGRAKLKELMEPYIRRLTPIKPSKIYLNGKSDRINSFLKKYILREEPHVETYIKRADEGKGKTCLDRQKDALARILRNGVSSDFGKRYRFDSLETVEEFENTVPISGFDVYCPMIRLTRDMGEQKVFTDNEIISYVLMEECDDLEKCIPVTHKAIVPYIKAMRLSIGCNKVFLMSEALPFKASRLTMDHKFRNSYFGVMLKEYMKEGEEFGSGYAAFTTPMDYLFPKKRIDMTVMRWVYALCDREVNTVFAPDKDTLVLRIKELKANWKIICEEIEKRDTDKAAELKDVFSSNESVSLKKLIPSLHTIVCWNYTDNEVSEFLRPFIQDLEFKRGYLADEYGLYGQIDEEGLVTLDPDSLFYEFLPFNAQDNDIVYTVKDVMEGEQYTLLISSLSGLYRYETLGKVECVNRDDKKVHVRFMN